MQRIGALAALCLSAVQGRAHKGITIPLEQVPMNNHKFDEEHDEHLLQAGHSSLQKDLSIKDWGYTGKVYFGSDMQEATLLFDTGSQVITVTSDACRNCESMVYTPEASTFNVPIKAWPEIAYHERKMHVETQIYEDRVCLQNSYSSEAQNFCTLPIDVYAIRKQVNLDPHIDGIFGLGPTSKDYKRTFTGNFVLKASSPESGESSIDHAVFGLLISPDTRTRTHEIIIGDYDEDLVEGGEDGIEWYNLFVNKSHEKNWLVKITDTWFGEEQECKKCHRKAMINMGFEGIGVPYWELNHVKKFIMPKTMEKDQYEWDCTNGVCMSTKQCRDINMDLIQDYTFEIQERMNYTIRAKDLLIDTEHVYNRTRYNCKFAIYWYDDISLNEAWLIGDTFLKNYYSIYDVDRNMVGLGRLVSDIRPRKEETDDGLEPDDEDVSDTNGDGIPDSTPADADSGSNGLLVALVICLSLAAIGLGIFLVWLKVSAKPEARNLPIVRDEDDKTTDLDGGKKNFVFYGGEDQNQSENLIGRDEN